MGLSISVSCQSTATPEILSLMTYSRDEDSESQGEKPPAQVSAWHGSSSEPSSRACHLVQCFLHNALFSWWSLLLYRWASLGPRAWGLHRVLSSASFTIKLTRLLLLGEGDASSVFILGNLGQTFVLSPVEVMFSYSLRMKQDLK